MANHNAVRAGQAYVEIFADAAKFQQQLRQTESEFRNWGQQMSAIGSSVAASFSMLPVASAINDYIKFDDAMRSVAAATGRSLKEIGVSNDELAKRLNVSISDMRRGQFEMEALAKKARQLGQSLSYTSAEVADAMVVLARAGQSISEIGHTVEAVLDMARATGTEVASAAQFVVGALHEFQLEATQTRRVVDLMTRTANASPQSLEDLGNALKYIGPVAHSMSLSIEEVMRDLGLLAKFNIRGEQAGTSMRNLYMRMTSELNQRKFKETFKVDLIDEETGAVRSLLDVLAETKKNIESLGLAKSDVADAFKQVFSLRALPAAFSLTEVVDRAHEMEIALSNARSEAYNARKVMDGGLGGAFRALKSDAQEAGHSLVESIEEPLIEIVRSIESAIEKIDSFIDRNRMLIGGLMKYGSIAAGAALTMGGLAVAAGAASKSFSGLLGVTRNFNKAAFDRFSGWGKQLTGRESIVKPEPKEPKINLRPIDEARTSVKALDEKLTDVARITSRAIVRFNNLAKGFYNVASKGQTAANSLSKLSTSVGLSFEHLRKFNAEFLKSKKAYGDARIKISALSRVVQTSTTRFNKASGALQKFGERNDYVGERVATLEKTLLSFQEKTSGVQDSVKKISAAFRMAATEIGQASVNYKSTATRLSQSLSVIASNLNRVVGRLNSGTRSFVNFQNAAEKLAASIKTSPSVYQTVEQAVDKFRERVRLASADVRDARRALDDAQKSLNAFGKTSGSNGVKTFATSLATASQAIQTIVGTSEQLVGALHASGEAFAFAAANAILYRDALAKIVQYNKALVDDTQGQKKKRNKKKNDDNDPPGGGGGGGTPTRTDRVIEKADEFIKDRNREEDVARKDSVPVSRADVQRKFGERVARRVDAKYSKRDRKDSERADKILATKRARDQAANELANLEARRTAPGLNVEQLAKLSSEIKEVKARIAGYDNTIKQLREARRNANAKSDVVSTNASRDAAERSLWDKHFWGTRPSLDERNAGAAKRSRRIQKQIDSANTRVRVTNKGYVSKLGVEFSRAANEAQKFTSANLKLQPAIQAEMQALRKSATLKTVSRNVDARLLDITQRLLAARREEQAAQQTYRQNETKRSPLDAARSARLNELGGGIQNALSRIPVTAALMKEPLEKWVEKHRDSLQTIRRLETWVDRLSKNPNVDNKTREQAQRRLDAAKNYHQNVVLGESKNNLFTKWLAPHLEAKSDLKRLSAERNSFATSTRGDLEQRRTERASDLGRLNTARNNTLSLEGKLAQALGNRAAVQQATALAERELASATANRVAALNAANAVSNGALGTFSGTPTVDQLQTLASESQDRQRTLNFESHQKGQTLVSENNKLFPETPWKYQDGKVVPVTPYSPPSPPVSPSPPNNPPSPPNNPPKETDAQRYLRLNSLLPKEDDLVRELSTIKQRLWDDAIQQALELEGTRNVAEAAQRDADILAGKEPVNNPGETKEEFVKRIKGVATPFYKANLKYDRDYNIVRSVLNELPATREEYKDGFQNALRNSPAEAASFVKQHSENLGNATDANRREKQTRFRVSSRLWAESMLRSGKGEDAYQSVSKEIERRGVRYANVMKAFGKRDADLKKQIDEQTKYAASLPAGTTPGHDVWGTVARLENERKENEKKRKRFAANESARASVLKRTQKGLGTGVIWQETAKWGEENAAKGRMNRPVADVTKGFDVAWKSAQKKLSKGGKLSSRDFNQLNELWNASGRAGTFGQFYKEGKAQQKRNKELEDKRSTSKGNWNLYNLHRTQYEESEQKRYALQNKIDATKAPILRQAEEMRANGASDKAVRAYLQGQFAASGELKSLNKELSATQQASNAALVAMDSAKQKAQKYDKKHGLVSENAGRARSEAVRAERNVEKADQMQAELRDEEREINRNRDETKSSISDKKNKISGYDSSIAELDKKLERFQEIENDPLQELNEKDKKERDELKRQRDAMEANRNVLQQELEADKQKLTSLDEDKKRLNQRQQDVGLIQQHNQERLLKARGLGKEFGLDGVDDPQKAQARKDFADANARKNAAKKEWSETRKQWTGPDSKFQKGWKAFSSGLTGVVKGLAGLRTATGRAIAMENAKAGFYRLTLMGLRGLAVASVKAAAGLVGIAAMSLMGVAIGLVTQALFKFGEWLTKWWKDDPKAHDEEFKAKQDEALQKRDEEVNKQTSREEHVRALEELSKQDYLTEENRKEASNRLIELQKNSTGDVDDFARLEKVKGKDGKESWKLKFDDYKAQSFLSEESKKVNKESENALQAIADGLGNKNINKDLKTYEDTVVNEQDKEESQQIQEERIAKARALIMQIKEEGGTISKDFAKKFRNQITESSDYLTFNGTAKFSKTSTSPNGIGTTNWEETTFATTEGSGIASEMLALADEIDALASDNTRKIFKTKFIEDGLATKRDDFATWEGRIESGDLDAEGLTDSYNNYIDFINRGIANASRALDEGVGNVGDVNKIQDELKKEIENVDKAYAQFRYEMGRKIDSERINRKSKNILKVYEEQKTRLDMARKERELIANDYGAGQFAEARAAAGSDKKKIEEIDKAEAAAKAEAKKLADERYQERANEINEDIKLETDRLLLSIYSEFDAGYGAQAEQVSLAARTKKQSVDGWVLGNVAAYDAETENLRQRQKELRNKKDASQEDRVEIDKLEFQIAERIIARDDFVKRYEDEGKSRKEEIDARATRDFEKLQERQFAGRFTDAERQMQTLIDNLDKNSDALADTKTYIAGLSDKTPEERKAMQEQAEKQAGEERDELLRKHSVATRQALTGHESGALGQFSVDYKGIEFAKQERMKQLQGMIDAEQAIVDKFGADSEEGKAALERMAETTLFKTMAEEFYDFKKKMEEAEKKLSLDRFITEMGTETGKLEGVSAHEFDAKKKNLEIDKQAKAANDELDRQIQTAKNEYQRLQSEGKWEEANQKQYEKDALVKKQEDLKTNVERVKKQNLADAKSEGSRETFEKDKRKQDSVVFGSEVRSSQADIQIAAIESMKTGGMFEEYDKMVDRQANRVRYSKAVSDYESAQSRAGVLNSQAQEAYKIWQDSIKNGASSDEVQANFEKYKSLWQESNSAQKGLQEALGSARQARRNVIKGEFERKESFSTGTFSAFEAMDAHNDWQKENTIKQTEFLKKICENTELGLWS